MSNEIHLSRVRLSFPKLVEAQSLARFADAGKKFGADLILAGDDPQMKRFMDLVRQIAAEKWKDNASAILNMLQNDRLKRCYGNGSEKVDKKTLKPYVGYEGNAYISASSREDKPPVMVRPDATVCDNANTLERQTLARKLYGGCYVNVVLRPWCQDNQLGRGIRCELVAVQFAADGEAFGDAPPDLTGMFQPAAAPAVADPSVPSWM